MNDRDRFAHLRRRDGQLIFNNVTANSDLSWKRLTESDGRRLGSSIRWPNGKAVGAGIIQSTGVRSSRGLNTNRVAAIGRQRDQVEQGIRITFACDHGTGQRRTASDQNCWRVVRP